DFPAPTGPVISRTGTEAAMDTSVIVAAMFVPAASMMAISCPGKASSVPVVDCAHHGDRENDAPDEEPGVPHEYMPAKGVPVDICALDRPAQHHRADEDGHPAPHA